MLQSRALVLASLCCVSMIALAAPGLEKKTKLYVGTQAGCNEGVVTTISTHLNCTTRMIGYSVDDASAVPENAYKEILVGVTAGRNEGVVTPNANHANGATTSVGYLSKRPVRQGVKLYVGIAACNNGVVTTNQLHAGCATTFIGYALPE